jgi:SAM-dependent methyltransferase
VGALEQQEVDDALRRLPGVEARVAAIRRRIAGFTELPPGARVLDIGAALGLHLVAWRRAGYEPVGVEPWAGAVEASSEVAARTEASFEIHQGSGESLPIADQSVDLVEAISVMEHVDEPSRVFAEAHRVLRPGGAFYFYTTSAICPRQAEIRLFPAFPWYPPRLQRRIMRWASERHAWLVHGTTAPAYHWFRPGPTEALLRRTGFERVIDRWEMRLPDEDSGIRGRLARAAKTSAAARLALNLAIEDSAYLALKPGAPQD